MINVSRLLNLARISTKGGFNLFWGVATSSIISAVGIMIIAGLLEEAQYGLFTIALTAPNFFQIIRDLGIDQATIKYTAQYNQEKQPEKIKNILLSGITSEFLSGLLLSIISFTISGYLATEIFKRPEISLYIQIASFTIFGGALTKIADAGFIGYEKMKYHSITLVIQSIFKTGLMIALVILNFGVYGAIIGHTLAFVITGAIAITLMYFKIFKKLKTINQKNEIKRTLKTMFKYGINISGAMIITGFLTQFYNIFIAIYLSNQIIGNYNLAVNFSVIVVFFVTPISTLLFPAFSKINAQKEAENLKKIFKYSVKYSSLLIIPTTLIVMSLSKQAVATIFPGKYELTPLFLSLNVIIYAYTAFGHLSSANLIKGQGRTDVNLKLNFLTAALGIILSLFLIPKFGITGLIITKLISTIPQLVISLWWIKKTYNATIDIISSTKILSASITAAILTYIFVNSINLANWILLITGVIIYLITYVITAALIGAITKKDTKNLKAMLKSLGPLSIPLNIPLTIIEKILKK